jgi:hypothetical protein
VHPGNELEDTLPELQGKGDLLLRRIAIKNSNLSYVTLARLIQSCEKLEEFTYLSPSGWDDEDTSPTAIIRALLSHKESLRVLGFDSRPRRHEFENFDQAPKLGSLEGFLCLEDLLVNHDCLPRKPLLPPSLKVLHIWNRGQPLEPDLFYIIRMASHLSFKLLLE